MLTIHILCVGSLKEAYWAQACAEYQKRLGAFCRLIITEVNEEKAPRSPSPAQIEQILQVGGGRLLAKTDRQAYTVAMCIEGKPLSSRALSEQINAVAIAGTSKIIFLIGGSFGLSDTVKQTANLQLSMSPMTFPHQLARVMLCEQIYRAFQISSGGKYHK